MVQPSREDRDYQNFVKKAGKWHRRTLEGSYGQFNSLEVKVTTIGTTATKIETPNGNDFTMKHVASSGVIYIGDSTVTTSTGYPLTENEALDVSNYKKGDNNEIYGVVASGTVDIYVIGSTKI